MSRKPKPKSPADKPVSLEELTKLVLAFRDERRWERYHDPKNLALGIFVEAAELAEHFQYLDGPELKEHIELFREEIGEEISDVLYWVLLTAHQLDIDLGEVFKKKMKKNAVKYPAPVDGGEGKGKISRMHQEKKRSKENND